jgi:hypothetical protein
VRARTRHKACGGRAGLGDSYTGYRARVPALVPRLTWFRRATTER